ncbi:hypothetical protein AB0L99_44050 [Streptomyces sp. NPDC051954]|uniref:hypothetical protein n=1 Tax=unclassified Streptomyces TaxID=2593676 RepID=UPI00341D8E79
MTWAATWSRLKQQLGSALPQMTLAHRVQVLTLVDQATPADQALLSSLVAASDPDMTTSYRKIAGRARAGCSRGRRRPA